MQLGGRLNIDPRCVQVWFQNRRQKWKNQHAPQGVSPPFRNLSIRLSDLDHSFPPGWPGTPENPTILPSEQVITTV